jgi:hypothetical protein
MKVFALQCPQCGGSQDVTDDRHHLECRYCRTLLRVERSATGELERLLIEAQQENAELLAENRRLALTNAIHRLDAKWAEDQKKLMVPGDSGLQAPSEVLGWKLILIGGIAVWAGIQYGFQVTWLGGLAFVVVGVAFGGAGIWQLVASQRFKMVRRWYERRRAQLCEELAELERAFEEPPNYRERKYEDTTARRKRLQNISYPAADA